MLARKTTAPVDGRGPLPRMLFADPGSDHGHQREPEQQVEVSPHGGAADAAGGPQ